MSGEAPITVETLLAEQDWLRALARRLVADDARADDLVQDVWVRVLTAPPRTVRSVRAWLTRVLVNRSRDVGRSETARAGRQDAVARTDRVPSAADLVARVDAQRRVAAAVLELDEPVRQTVLLRFFEDLPVREVARRMGVPYETARARLTRGLAALRAGLAERDSKGRRCWSAGFLALAGFDRAKEAAAAAALTGAVVAMKTKLAAVAAVVVLLAVGVGGWNLLNSIESESPPEPAPEVVAVVPSDPEGKPESPDGDVAVAPTAPEPTSAEEELDPECGAVRGRITFSDGSPAAGLEVRLSGRPAKVATTDDNGRYRIVNEWVDALGRSLYVGPATGMTDLGMVPLRAGAEIEIDRALPDGRALDVEVVSAEDGRPLPGVWVSFDPLEGPPSPSALCIVDGEGKGRVEWLAPRDFRVYIASRGHRPWATRLNLTEGVPPTRLRIALHDPEELILHVTPVPVEMEDLHPSVSFVPTPDDPVKGRYHAILKMAADGTARGVAPAPGTYTALVKAGSLVGERIEGVVVREREPVTIRVTARSGVVLSGVLVDPDGNPLAGTVSFQPIPTPGGLTPPGARTDAEGRFRMSSVPVGKGWVSVYIGGQSLNSVIRDFEVGEGGVADLRIQLSGRQTLKGRITGSRLPNSHDVLLHRPGTNYWECVTSAETKDDGSFVLRYLEPGRHVLTARALRAEDGWAAPVEIEIRKGEVPEDLSIPWRETPGIEVFVTDHAGRPVSGPIQVWASAPGSGPLRSRSARGQLDEHGRFVTRALAPGRLRLMFTVGTGEERRGVMQIVEVKEKDNPPIRITLSD